MRPSFFRVTPLYTVGSSLSSLSVTLTELSLVAVADRVRKPGKKGLKPLVSRDVGESSGDFLFRLFDRSDVM